MSNTKLSRGTYDKGSKYIDFKINGRLFPAWVMKNFKKYKLEEVFKKTGDDPCNVKTDDGVKGDLRKYQLFLSTFLDYKSPYRTQLVFHGLG